MDKRGGAEHAAAFYEEWDFAQKAVELYAAAVSWKGLTVFGVPEGENNGSVIAELSESALRTVLPEWMVKGETRVHVNCRTSTSDRSGQKEATLTLLTPWQFGVDRGSTLLWPACSNHEALVEMRARLHAPMAQQLLLLMLGFAHQHLALPEWALNPLQAREATAQMVTMGLHFFRLRVNQWRDSISADVEDDLREIVAKPSGSEWQDVYATWNASWSPENGYEGWEALYEAFASCGITLDAFAAEYVATLRKATETGLFPRAVLAGWRRLGF